jgi:hypothetical protein
MRIQGGCHCGKVSYEAEADPAYVAYIQVPAQGFKLKGQPKVYVKTPESGNLRLGGVRQRAQLAPKSQVWCNSALPWSMDLGGVKQHSKNAG